MNCTYLETEIGLLEIICDDEHLFEINKVETMGKQNVNIMCEKIKNELLEYFSGEREIFDIPIKLTGTEFQNKVWNELLKISFGELLTYYDVAKRIGNAKAVRAVANAIGKNKLLVVVPCHRVIGTNNSLTGFSAGLLGKIHLLNLEGHNITIREDLKHSKIIKT